MATPRSPVHEGLQNVPPMSPRTLGVVSVLGHPASPMHLSLGPAAAAVAALKNIAASSAAAAAAAIVHNQSQDSNGNDKGDDNEEGEEVTL